MTWWERTKVLIQRVLGRSDVEVNGELYMRRWRFRKDNTWGFRLHNILKSDEDRELHDHPFTFITFILWGGYWEHLADGSRTWHGMFSCLKRPATTLHRLELAPEWRKETDERGITITVKRERPAWTFVLRSRYFREWGFQTPTGWIHWRDFVEKKARKPASTFAAPSST